MRNGPMRGIAQENLPADMGQLKLIGTELSIHSTGPCEHPARKPPNQPWAYPTVSAAAVHKTYWPIPANRQNLEAPAMGPCKGLHQKAYRPPWASSSSSAQSCQFTAWAHVSILPGSSPTSYRHSRQSRQKRLMHSMGQFQPIVKILKHAQWAHARDCTRELIC
jgi:hypothetical protein